MLLNVTPEDAARIAKEISGGEWRAVEPDNLERINATLANDAQAEKINWLNMELTRSMALAKASGQELKDIHAALDQRSLATGCDNETVSQRVERAIDSLIQPTLPVQKGFLVPIKGDVVRCVATSEPSKISIGDTATVQELGVIKGGVRDVFAIRLAVTWKEGEPGYADFPLSNFEPV